MLMSTQHMVSSNDYGFTPVGGRLCKETDLSALKATIQLEMEPLHSCNTRKKVPYSCSHPLTFTTKGYSSSTARERADIHLPLQQWSLPLQLRCWTFESFGCFFCVCLESRLAEREYEAQRRKITQDRGDCRGPEASVIPGIGCWD